MVTVNHDVLVALNISAIILQNKTTSWYSVSTQDTVFSTKTLSGVYLFVVLWRKHHENNLNATQVLSKGDWL